MQQALENPHFKKIWEEVNWKIRHPEAKSLDEALQEELNHYGCCFFNPNQIMSTGVIVGWDNAGYRYISTEGIDDKKQSIIVHIKDKFYQNSLIIGRPITLEDIMVLLRGKNTALDAFVDHYHINFAIWKEGDTEFDCVKEWCFRVEPYSQNYHNMGAGFFWQLTKPLHEQSHETWEEISKLINK